MGKRGPKPVPRPLRLLRGQTRSSQDVTTPRPQASGAPVCPSDLDPQVQAVWRRTVRSMPPGLYARADEATLRAFCVAAVLHYDAARALATEPTVLVDRYGRHYLNPLVKVVSDQARQIVTLGNILGLNPTARDQLRDPAAAQDDNSWDGLLKAF